MEIQTTTNVSPQAENLSPQPAAKKSKSGNAQEFDASLIATLMQMGGTKESAMPMEAAAKVELSGKGSEAQAAMQKVMAAQAQSAEADASKQMRFPDAETLIQTQTTKNANGTMTDAFVAGPNQPWSPNWVFGAQKSEISQMMHDQKQGQSPQAGSMADLMSQMQRLAEQAQGGDAKQVSQAGDRLNQELGGMLSQLGGEIQQMDLPAEGQQPKNASNLNRVGGEAFLGLLQGVQTQDAQGGMGGFAQNSGGQSQQKGLAQQQAQKALASAGSTTSSSPNLQLINGGGRGRPLPIGGAKEEAQLPPELLLGGSAAFAPSLDRGAAQPLPPPMLTGHVVPGSMMRERLTSETIQNMSNTVSDLSVRGGGEMRIRMNPGNLGELTIRVSTQGNTVGLKVQATDPHAKKILEESLSSLKDSLAQQSLALSRVDISVAQPSQQASSQFNQQFNQGDAQAQAWNAQSQNGMMNFDGQGTQGRESSGSSEGAPVDFRASRARAVSSMNSGFSGSSARDASGRLNVIA